MEQYVIKGGSPLVGEVEVGGAKNAALAILTAAVMTDEPVMIDNIPDVSDINVLLEAISVIGATVERIDRHTVRINGATIGSVSVDYEFIKKNRQFGIVRLHDNEANGLKSSLANENIITFETDRFSIYTLVAKDYTQAEVNKDPDVLNNSIVKTGDDTSSMLPMIFMAASLLVIIGILEMKRREVNRQK